MKNDLTNRAQRVNPKGARTVAIVTLDICYSFVSQYHHVAVPCLLFNPEEEVFDFGYFSGLFI